MLIEDKNSTIGQAFEEMMNTVLWRECSKIGKPFYSQAESSFYFLARHNIENRFDAFAPNGIYDSKPTGIEYHFINSLTSSSISNLKKKIDLFIKNNRAYGNSIKTLFIVYYKNSAKNNTLEYDLNYLLRDNKKDNIEIWLPDRIDKLLENYPIEYISFNLYSLTKTNSSKGIYTTIEKFPDDKSFAVNNEEVKNELHNAIRNNSFSLVLGTGVSIPYNSLTWKDINEKLYQQLPAKEQFIDKEKAFKKIGGDYLSSTQYIKQNLKHKYAKSLFSILYPTRFKKPNTQTSLDAIGNFISNRKPNKVITFNYDDFLEQRLKQLNIKHEPLFTPNDYPKNGIPIFHVHGFLPSSAIEKDYKKYIDSIVLTEEEYFCCYSNGLNWQVAVQLETFKDDVCLFVGNSITDYNEKRLLNNTKQNLKHHYAIMLKDGLAKEDLLKIYSYYEFFMNIKIIWAEDSEDIVEIIDTL